MATSRVISYHSYSNNPLSEVNAYARRTGYIKFIYFAGPRSPMTYNVEYFCGTLPEQFRPYGFVNNLEFYGNDRNYLIKIYTDGKVYLKCLSNDLPSSGIPIIQNGIVYI